MLKLEDVYDVAVAKDGQEAYEKVKESMSKGRYFDLIFMDVQVSYYCFYTKLLLIKVDAKCRWPPKHPINSSNGLLRPDRRTNRICRRE